MISRLTRDARIPADPIVMPSEIETVLNSIGVPPALRTPSFTDAAISRRWKLQGPISVQVLAIPTIGLASASRPNPDARSIARAPARLGPSVIAPLCHLPVPPVGLSAMLYSMIRVRPTPCQTYNVFYNIRSTYEASRVGRTFRSAA